MSEKTSEREPSSYFKRGYLDSDFRLFHLTDVGRQEFEFHYHDFDKIVIFLSGRVTYLIEGRSYELLPYDIVLVNHNEIHRPLIDMGVPYERIIVYLTPGFLDTFGDKDGDLGLCFQEAKEQHSHVLRMPNPGKSPLFFAIRRLKEICRDDGYASLLYRKVLFLEFMIELNRAMRSRDLDFSGISAADERILNLMDYINRNLTEPLDIDELAGRFHFSRYYLMRLFKQETGYTIGRYITSKRLLLARELVCQKLPLTQICYQCGFKNYASFSRAYRIEFHESPSATRKRG